MGPVASCQNPKPIEVYSSSNSTLPTNISLRKKNWEEKQRKTQKVGLANGEALCTQKRIAASKSRSIKMPQHWMVPKREMLTDIMFLLVVCYTSTWSCLQLFFPSSVRKLSRFKEVSFVMNKHIYSVSFIDCKNGHLYKSISISVRLFSDTVLK